MGLEVIVLLAIGAWFAALLFAVSLCRAAKAGDAAADDCLLDQMTAREGAAQPPVDPPPVDPPPVDSLPVDSPLRTLELHQAAALLDVFPEMLLAWEARYGFPTSTPSAHLYSQSEILALCDTLRRESSIAAAVARARARTRRRRGPTRPRVADQRDGGLAS
jgi:hypothetical protein